MGGDDLLVMEAISVGYADQVLEEEECLHVHRDCVCERGVRVVFDCNDLYSEDERWIAFDACSRVDLGCEDS